MNVGTWALALLCLGSCNVVGCGDGSRAGGSASTGPDGAIDALSADIGGPDLATPDTAAVDTAAADMAATDVPDATAAEPDRHGAEDVDAGTPLVARVPSLGEALCVSVHLYDPERRRVALEALKEAGIRQVRAEVLWHEMEPAKGAFDFGVSDQRVMPYVEEDIDVVLVLAYGNAWAASAPGADNYYPPDDPQDFGDFVATAVARYGAWLARFEIWNEPNAGFRFWKPLIKGDPAAFGALLKVATASGRSACPGTCSFAFGAPFFHSQVIDGHIPFLTGAYEAHPDLSASFDAMGIHPYPFYPPQAAPEGPPPQIEQSFDAMVAGVRGIMDANGGEGTPLWATEVGWPIFGVVDEERQAAYLVRGVMRLVAAGVSPVCWYTLFDGPEPDSFPPEQAFGLLTNGSGSPDGKPAPKPAFQALRNLGTRFAEYRPARALGLSDGLPAGVWGFELRSDSSGPAWWTLWAHPDPVQVTLPFVPEASLDQRGEPIVTGAGLQLDLRPVFVALPTP